MRTFFLTLLTATLVFPAASFVMADEPRQVVEVDTHTAAQLVDEKKVTVLDVRTPVEFKEGHIEGAVNHDFVDDNFKQGLSTLDKEKPYLIHCESGGRSARSIKMMKALGFKNLYHYSGGMRAWEKAGKPVKK